MPHFDLHANEVNSFDGRFYRFSTITGPIDLVRFSDSRRGLDGRYGRYWLYGSELAEILKFGSAGSQLIKQISKRWAICDDWGDKRLAWRMTIPKGVSVPAAFGRAKFQPKVSVESQQKAKRERIKDNPNQQIARWRETVRSYAGGSMQLVIPVVDENGRPDPYLTGLISGPENTMTL